VRAEAAADAAEQLAVFLKEFKRLQRQLVAGASLAAEAAGGEAARARAALNHQAGSGAPLTAAAASRSLNQLQLDNDRLRESLLVAELRAHEQASRVIETFDTAHGELARERAEVIDGVLR
jgi:hypothetical protein